MLKFCSTGPTVARGVSGGGSGFRVGWREAGGGDDFFFRGFSSGAGGAGPGWALGYVQWGLNSFLGLPNFLRSKVLSCLATREVSFIYHVYK